MGGGGMGGGGAGGGTGGGGYSDDDCFDWWAECMEGLWTPGLACLGECAWELGLKSASTWVAVIACGVTRVAPNPVTLALCLGLGIGDAIAFVWCFDACTDRLTLEARMCKDAFEWCLSHAS